MENKKIVSIQDLIKNKEAIQERKNKLYIFTVRWLYNIFTVV